MFRKLFRIAFVVLLTLWVGGYFMFLSNIISKKTPAIENKAGAIIVLTGGNNRIKTGLELFASSRLSNNLFISGVHASVKEEDIISMWVSDKKLPDCCITLGYKASTTFENAQETKEWLDNKNIKTLVLVTSNYHINRAMLEFENIIEDITIIAYPVKEKRSLIDINFWKISFSEYNKFLIRYALIGLER